MFCNVMQVNPYTAILILLLPCVDRSRWPITFKVAAVAPLEGNQLKLQSAG